MRWPSPRTPGSSWRSGRRDGEDRHHRTDRLRQVDRRPLAGRAVRVWPSSTRTTRHAWSSPRRRRRSRLSIGGSVRTCVVPTASWIAARSAGWSSAIPTRCTTSKRSSIPPSGRASSRRSSARSGQAPGPWSIEAIKLVEGGLADLCDEVWLVTCDPDVQRDRLVGRGDAEADAADRVEAQGDLVDRLRTRATRVVDTDGDPADTRAHAAMRCSTRRWRRTA